MLLLTQSNCCDIFLSCLCCNSCLCCKKHNIKNEKNKKKEDNAQNVEVEWKEEGKKIIELEKQKKK